MARTIRTIDVVNAQSYKVTVHGLNIGTALTAYYDSQKVAPAHLQPMNGKAGDQLITDANGKCEFIFYLTNPVGSFANKPEAEFIELLSKDAGLKTFTVVDKASIDTDSLLGSFKVIARCYAEIAEAKGYEVTFNEVKDWGSSGTAAGSTYKKTAY